MDAKDFLDPDYRYAIVGASADVHKYGHKVFQDLRSAGLTVIPVNPKLSDLDGLPAVGTIVEISPLPDVVVMIIPPEIGLHVMETAVAAGQKKFWFQPGAESKEIRQRAEELGINVMADGSCIMVDRRALGIKKSLQTSQGS